MSDAFYRERAARRTRIWLLVGLFAVIAACLAFAAVNLFRDSCTQSFDRAPRSLVAAFTNAVSRGDAQTAQACWQHNAYYDLEAGCSEICLSKALGARYQIVAIRLDEPVLTPEGRVNVTARVTVACQQGGEQHTAEVLLDSVGAQLPWRHWKIIHSTVGGSVARPWCKE